MTAVRPGFQEAHHHAESKRASRWFLFSIFISVLVLAVFGVGQWDPGSQSPGIPAVATAGAQSKAGGPSEVLGAKIYGEKCSGCHGSKGKGIPNLFPPLAGDPVITAEDPLYAIRAVLFGLHGSIIGGISYRESMPPWAGQLSDDEVAAVINHARTSWGNNAPAISPSDVAKVRSEGAP
ncbi:MAG: cytochrome c [Candidatus Sulfobium sp.]